MTRGPNGNQWVCLAKLQSRHFVRTALSLFGRFKIFPDSYRWKYIMSKFLFEHTCICRSLFISGSLGITLGIFRGVSDGDLTSRQLCWWYLGFYSHPYHPKPWATSANITNKTFIIRLYIWECVIFTGERKLPLRQTMMDWQRKARC